MSDLADTRFSVNGPYPPKDDNERSMLDLLPEDPEEGTVKVPLHARNRHRTAPPETRPSAPEIAGLPEGWVTPDGWLLSPHGVWEIRGSGRRERAELIAARPLWIAGRLRDVDSGRMFLRLAWPGGAATMERAEALCHREILRLASQDAPVSSQSAAGVVRWLLAADEANRNLQPISPTVGRLGWIEGTGGAPPIWQGPDGPLFLRAEEGEGQVVAAMRPRGEWEVWRELAGRVHAVSPVALMVLAASVGSILLARIGPVAAPFVVDLSGGSGKGKTVALRWAASAWADPADKAVWIKPWSSNPPAIEAYAAFLQNAPLMLDDTRKLNLRRRQELGGVVYQWASGQGVGRGRIEGAREVRTWRSVILSTGEVPLPSILGQDIGLRLRMVRIEDDPFPEDSPLVSEIEGIDTWGHAGPRVAAWAVTVGDEEMKKSWREVRAWLQTHLGGGNWAARVGGYGATIWLGMLALREIGVPIRDTTEMGAMLLRWLRAGIDSADVAGCAWDRLCAWLASQGGRIVTHAGPESRPDPAGGWLGRTAPVTREDREIVAVCVLPSVVDVELRRWGYDPDDVLPAWEKRGLLLTGDQRARKVRWLGKVVRLYALHMEGWSGAVDDSGSEASADWH